MTPNKTKLCKCIRNNYHDIYQLMKIVVRVIMQNNSHEYVTLHHRISILESIA